MWLALEWLSNRQSHLLFAFALENGISPPHYFSLGPLGWPRWPTSQPFAKLIETFEHSMDRWIQLRLASTSLRMAMNGGGPLPSALMRNTRHTHKSLYINRGPYPTFQQKCGFAWSATLRPIRSPIEYNDGVCAAFASATFVIHFHRSLNNGLLLLKYPTTLLHQRLSIWDWGRKKLAGFNLLYQIHGISVFCTAFSFGPAFLRPFLLYPLANDTAVWATHNGSTDQS